MLITILVAALEIMHYLIPSSKQLSYIVTTTRLDILVTKVRSFAHDHLSALKPQSPESKALRTTFSHDAKEVVLHEVNLMNLRS